MRCLLTNRPTGVWAAALFLIVASVFAGQVAQYRVQPVYAPPLDRPPLSVSRENLPRGASGALPSFDGERFYVNFAAAVEGATSEEAIRGLANQLLKALKWERKPEEITLARKATSKGAQPEIVDRWLTEHQAETTKRLTGKIGKLSTSTQSEIEKRNNEMKARAAASHEVMVFEQRVNGVPIDNSGIVAVIQQGKGLTSLAGRVFNKVEIGNRKGLSEAEAVKASEAYVAKSTKLAKEPPPKPELVIFPYGKAMLYAWRMDVAAEEGSYRLWLNAQTGKVLQLEPLFAADSATGLVFNPDPTAGTTEQGFEVDPPAEAGANYRLNLASRETLSNLGADGQGTSIASVASGSGSANFNVSPINGTVVDRTSSANYNTLFQQVNAFSWVYASTKLFQSLGSQTFPSMAVTVNSNNPCGFGINNSCGGGNQVSFGIGQAAVSNSTSVNDVFNSAIDATVVVHEWGHNMNRLQFAVGGGTFTGAIDEGLADFWAAAAFNNTVFGNWWGHNRAAPVQSGFVPRQVDPLDAFPSHRTLCGQCAEAHADGQIVNWALWNTRTGLNNLSGLGTLVIDIELVKALTTAGVGITNGNADKQVHDSYLDLLQQLSGQFGSVSDINKLFAGFARAGIFLSERDGVIDIDDDYLARGSATGPTFTVWTGRNYNFTGLNVNANQNLFNTKFTIEVANDAAFTVQHVSSGVLTGVPAGPGNVPTATWQLPASDWNNLKGENYLYYKVTTTDDAGANSRSSLSPGNGFMTNVPPPSATINESGQCECTCSGAAPGGGGSTPWIMLAPLAIAFFWRRRLRTA